MTNPEAHREDLVSNGLKLRILAYFSKRKLHYKRIVNINDMITLRNTNWKNTRMTIPKVHVKNSDIGKDSYFVKTTIRKLVKIRIS